MADSETIARQLAELVEAAARVPTPRVEATKDGWPIRALTTPNRVPSFHPSIEVYEACLKALPETDQSEFGRILKTMIDKLNSP